MRTDDRYVLSHFPLVVDPLAESLEIRAALCPVLPDGRADRVAASARWTQLHRVLPSQAEFPFALTTRMVHFFGPEPKAADCPYMLVYDMTGFLRYRLDRADGDLVPTEIPDEMVGARVTLPSVRLTFRTAAEADTALRLVAALRDDSGPAPETAEFLARVVRGCEAAFHTTVSRPAP